MSEPTLASGLSACLNEYRSRNSVLCNQCEQQEVAIADLRKQLDDYAVTTKLGSDVVSFPDSLRSRFQWLAGEDLDHAKTTAGLGAISLLVSLCAMGCLVLHTDYRKNSLNPVWGVLPGIFVLFIVDAAFSRIARGAAARKSASSILPHEARQDSADLAQDSMANAGGGSRGKLHAPSVATAVLGLVLLALSTMPSMVGDRVDALPNLTSREETVFERLVHFLGEWWCQLSWLKMSCAMCLAGAVVLMLFQTRVPVDIARRRWVTLGVYCMIISGALVSYTLLNLQPLTGDALGVVLLVGGLAIGARFVTVRPSLR